MEETIQDLLTRRSVRSFNKKPVAKEDIEKIVEAGKYAPNGQGKQAGLMVVVQNPELLEKLRRLNCTSVGREYTRDNFYGGSTVIVVLADKSVSTHVYDGALVMGNLMNAAHALGISSIWIHRAKETFETEEGKQILKDLGIEGDYEGIGNCVLGYSDDPEPAAKPRKENFVYYAD